MSDLADSARLKLDRAEHHLSELSIAIAPFRDPRSYGVSFKDVGDSRVGYYTTQQPGTLSAAKLIAGDVLHNIRSSLDQLLFAMVIANKEGKVTLTELQQATHRQFPIGRGNSIKRSDIRDRAKGVSDEVLRKLYALNPCKGGDRVIWQVHELNIVDKHLMMPTFEIAYSLNLGRWVTAEEQVHGRAAALRLFEKNGELWATVVQQRVEPGKIFCTAPKHLPHPLPVEFEVVLFAPNVVERAPVLETFKAMVDRCREVIDLFSEDCQINWEETVEPAADGYAVQLRRD